MKRRQVPFVPFVTFVSFVAVAVAVVSAQETTTTNPIGRKSPPMPTQKQSIDYFAGEWTFKRLGADSPVAPGAGTGTVTFKTVDGKLQGIANGKLDDGAAYEEKLTASFDDAKKALVWTEQRPPGVTLSGTGDWSSPIAIRFLLDPVKVQGQSYQVKRTISIISAASFHVVEEVSVNGGPFKRLGNALYTRK